MTLTKKSFTYKLLVGAILTTLLCVVMTTMAFASSVPIMEGTYTGSYTWENDTLTLTADLTVEITDGYGICFETNTPTIDLNGHTLTINVNGSGYGIVSFYDTLTIEDSAGGGNLYVTTTTAGAIYCSEDIIINTTGDVSLTSTGGYGVYANGGAIDITCDNLTIESYDFAIFASKSVELDIENNLKITSSSSSGIEALGSTATVTVGGTTDITAGDSGISAKTGVTVTTENDLNITASSIGICASDDGADISLNVAGDVNIKASNYGISAMYAMELDSNITIDVVGDVTITADEGTGIGASDDITMNITGDVTINAGYCGIRVIGNLAMNVKGTVTTIDQYGIWADGDLTIGADAVVITCEVDACDMTIYGEVQVYQLRAKNLTIKNGATVILGTTEDVTPSNSIGLQLFNEESPTLTLDSQVKLTTPGSYVIDGSDGVITTDGKDIEFEYGNLATYIVFQTEYSITASQTGEGTITPDSVTLYKGSDQTYTITADIDYEISDVLVDGVSVGAVSSYTFENVSANYTLEVVFSAINLEYEFTDGADQTVTLSDGGDASFTVDGDFDKFTGNVYINGTLLDPANYTAEEGSTIITLTADYLQTLDAGTYTLLVEYQDGTAETTFTIVADVDDDDADADDDTDEDADEDTDEDADEDADEDEDEDDAEDVPGTATGDHNSTLPIALSVIAMAGMIVLMKKKALAK